MTNETMRRCAKVMLYQNNDAPPRKHNFLNTVYVIGTKVFLDYVAACDWIAQTIGKTHIEKVNYADAYDYAKENNLLFSPYYGINR